MIEEAKNLLSKIITEKTGIQLVVRSAVEERNAINARKFPVASIISLQGRFDNTAARITGVRWPDGTVKKVYVRGRRTVPLTVRVWTKSTAEAALDAILPYIPPRWRFGHFAGIVSIDSTDLSDFTSNTTGQSASAIVISFEADYAAEVT